MPPASHAVVAECCLFRSPQHNLDGLEKALRAEFALCPPLYAKPADLDTINPAPRSVVPASKSLVSKVY